MWTLKSTIRLFVSAWLLCLLFACGSTAQAETMYLISESELTRLEANLNQLAKNNEIKQQLLTEQKTQLTEANQQLETVKKELTASKSLNAVTQRSLEKANQSLTEYEKEARHKVQVKARQRNLWIGVAGVAVYLYVRKMGA